MRLVEPMHLKSRPPWPNLFGLHGSPITPMTYKEASRPFSRLPFRTAGVWHDYSARTTSKKKLPHLYIPRAKMTLLFRFLYPLLFVPLYVLAVPASMASTPSCATSGSTICCTALVPVSVISINTKFNIPEPTNQTVATEIVQEILQADSTIATATNQGSQTIQATYNIEATLCLPSSSTVDSHPQTIQILTHALGTGKKYWDIAPGYSYVNAAVAAGYATLAYNKLGCGQSDHPDPIEVVQTSIDVEILHGLIQILRQGALGYSGFKHIIGVGHSYGSIVQLADNAKYPADVDATVLTGFVNNGSNVPFTLSTNNPAIAAINNPSAFGGLPTGYVVDDTRISVQQPFFRFPFFDNSSKS